MVVPKQVLKARSSGLSELGSLQRRRASIEKSVSFFWTPFGEEEGDDVDDDDDREHVEEAEPDEDVDICDDDDDGVLGFLFISLFSPG